MPNARKWLWIAATPIALGQAVPEDIRDQLDPIPIASVDPDELPWWMIITAIVAALGLLALLILWIRRRRRLRRNRPEHRLAVRLAELKAQPLPARQLYSELRGVVVDHLESRLDLRARSRSSSELIQAFQTLGVPEDELRQFLSLSDHAKFSGSAQAADPEAAIDQCERVLLRIATISKLAVIGRTGANRDAAV
jgi:MYXO-CTERM domain-containing protein